MPWNLFRTTIIDDAGQRLPLVSRRVLATDTHRSDPAFQRVIDRLGRVRVARGVGIRIAVAGGIAFILLMALFPVMLPATPYLIRVLVCTALLLPFVFAANSRTLSGEGDEVVALFLADSICPHCAYNLAAQSAREDGMTTCPECGAHWRASRMLRRHAFQTVEQQRRLGLIARFFYGELNADQSTGPGFIIDDLGVRRPIVAVRLAAPIRAASGDDKDRLQQARREMLGHDRAGRIGWAVVIGLVLGIAAVMSMISAPSGGMASTLLRGLFFLWLVLTVPLMMIRSSAGIKARHVWAAMLNRDLCPSCAADLSAAGIDPEHGGRICPDCQANWGGSVRLTPAHCTSCRYPIAGLTPDARGGVRCPECGHIMPATPIACARVLARCPECQHSLAGRRLRADGQIDCQHCGAWTSHCTQYALDLAARPDDESMD